MVHHRSKYIFAAYIYAAEHKGFSVCPIDAKVSARLSRAWDLDLTPSVWRRCEHLISSDSAPVYFTNIAAAMTFVAFLLRI